MEEFKRILPLILFFGILGITIIAIIIVYFDRSKTIKNNIEAFNLGKNIEIVDPKIGLVKVFNKNDGFKISDYDSSNKIFISKDQAFYVVKCRVKE